MKATIAEINKFVQAANRLNEFVTEKKNKGALCELGPEAGKIYLAIQNVQAFADKLLTAEVRISG